MCRSFEVKVKFADSDPHSLRAWIRIRILVKILLKFKKIHKKKISKNFSFTFFVDPDLHSLEND